MWNPKCGMMLIGRGDKPRDRWLSADYHTSLSTGSAGVSRNTAPRHRAHRAHRAEIHAWVLTE